ncbi:MAG: hypothetical protein KAS78_03050, partial [Candidatus Pacebacteria bacterium]|nr:hypothetical protein [Candidatus Paceibacterota bacterium]
VELSQSEIERQQLIESVKEQEKDKKLSEEDKEKNKIKAMAENFTITYYSYKPNDFSNIKSLQDKMTYELWEQQLKIIEQNQKGIKDDSKKYITFNVRIKNSEIIYLNKNEAKINISYIHEKIYGGIIQGEIAIKYVDEFGEDRIPSPTEKTEKKASVTLIKENEIWRLNEIYNYN